MPDQYARIFLLSHMRAYTSLTGHILGSNPAINGYYEMHQSYEEAAALDRQLAELRRHETIKQGSRYVFDKLLHNQYRLELGRLGDVDAKLLLSLREPESSIKSIVDLFSKKESGASYASPTEATRYYIERLEWLADFCRRTDHDYFYFDSQLFQTEPHGVLCGLSDWLELETPLSEEYRLFSQTGKARKGDTSTFIHSGKIERSRSEHSQVQLPKPMLQNADAAYRKIRSLLIEGATTSVTE